MNAAAIPAAFTFFAITAMQSFFKQAAASPPTPSSGLCRRSCSKHKARHRRAWTGEHRRGLRRTGQRPWIFKVALNGVANHSLSHPEFEALSGCQLVCNRQHVITTTLTWQVRLTFMVPSSPFLRNDLRSDSAPCQLAYRLRSDGCYGSPCISGLPIELGRKTRCCV